MTLKARVLAVLRSRPKGMTSYEVYREISSVISYDGVRAMLSHLHRKGLVATADQKESRRGRNKSVVYLPKKQATLVDSFQSEESWKARAEKAEAELEKLLEWKKAAIRSFPTLDVDPITEQARRLVADTLVANGRHGLAREYLAGGHDSKMLMKIAVRAIEAD